MILGPALHEDLTASGAQLSYPALTAFCRRHGIGQTPVVPVGQYHFEPGVEMQHDTSPHEVEVGGKKYQAQTASAVLCYSRLLFFQIKRRRGRPSCVGVRRQLVTSRRRLLSTPPSRGQKGGPRGRAHP
jgi:hypothetical protein